MEGIRQLLDTMLARLGGRRFGGGQMRFGGRGGRGGGRGAQGTSAF